MSILNQLELEVSNNLEANYCYEIEKQVYGISEMLKKIRIDKEITQVSIANKTGLSKQMVSKIEHYNGNPTLTTLVKYCDCIGINLLELLEQQLQKK